MDRRNFLASTGRLMLVTSGLFITGKVALACHHDDDNYGGYYNGYYSGGYYDDKHTMTEEQIQNIKEEYQGQRQTDQNQNQKSNPKEQ